MPLFVVGFARSGTTLAQRLVAEHFEFPTLPETHFFERLGKHGPRQGLLPAPAARELLVELQAFLELDLARHQALLRSPTVSVRALFLSLLGEQLGSVQVAASGHWLEKTPAHLGRLPQILAAFHDAHFLLVVRNPLASFASRQELARPGCGWGETWQGVDAMSTRWLQLHERAEAFAAMHPGRVLWVRLEDLAAAPAASLARIGTWLGRQPAQGWQLRPLQTRIVQPFEPWKLPALGAVDPAVATRQGRPGLDAEDSAQVRALLGAWMRRLGYLPPSASGDAAASATCLESGVGALDDSSA